MKRAQAGFSLIEVLIAAAVTVVLSFFMIFSVRSFLRWSALLAQRQSDEASVGALLDRWQAEADSAWSIFTPPADLLGQSNADGHEVDFFTRDGTNRPTFWAYRYDAQAQTLQRYVYASPGSAPAADGAPLAGIAAFRAHTYPITALQDNSSPIYSSLYAGAALQASAVHFGYVNQPWIAGGNQITSIHIAAASVARDVQLVTQTAPSGFIVELRYTPAPTPSASPAVAVWPAAVRYAQSGTQITDTNAPSMTMASALNLLLGGGEARASGTCSAVAYADTGFMQRLAPGMTDPWGAGASVDGAGCYNSGAIVVHEANYSGTFIDQPNNCGLTAGAWSPSTASGPTAAQPFTGGSTTTNGCTLPFVDANGRSAQAEAQVIAPCWQVGGTCTFSVTWPNDNPYCDPVGGSLLSGYNGTGEVTVSGPGTVNPAGIAFSSGTFTFTRTGTGTATINELAKYQKWYFKTSTRGQLMCAFQSSFQPYSAITVPSV